MASVNMRKSIIVFLFLSAWTFCAFSRAISTPVQTQIDNLKMADSLILNKISKMEERISAVNDVVGELDDKLNSKIDSVSGNTDKVSAELRQTAQNIGKQLKDEKETLSSSISDVKDSFSMKYILLIASVIVLILLLLFLAKKRSNNTDKSIKLLSDTQKMLEEQSAKIDQQLLEILEKQMSVSAESTKNNAEPDHSLPLKVADEIVRIQNNISRMDENDKNVLRLNKALERMKACFTAYGYEIVDMRGQEYTDNMPFEARFIPDDDIEPGKRIITGMDRLMVRYNGNMIQAPILAVRQNV